MSSEVHVQFEKGVNENRCQLDQLAWDQTVIKDMVMQAQH